MFYLKKFGLRNTNSFGRVMQPARLLMRHLIVGKGNREQKVLLTAPGQDIYFNGPSLGLEAKKTKY
jgi:hypothetical protein